MLACLAIEFGFDSDGFAEVHVVAAFGDDDKVGSPGAEGWFAEHSFGEEFVAGVEPVGFGEEDGEGGADVAVLEGVVEEDDLWSPVVGEVEESADGSSPVGVNGHGDVGEFAFDLAGFVACLVGSAFSGGEDES